MQISPQTPNPSISLSAVSGYLLVADDDPDQRAFLAESLRAQAYTVREAEHGLAALELCRQQLPDAILLDVVMPGLDGFEVCRRLKIDPATSHIPILLVTSLTDRSDRIKGIEAGANDFVSKPVDIEELYIRVRNSVYLKRLYDRLLEENGKLQGLASQRDSLTHLVVHDMKAPLDSIDQSVARLRAPGARVPGVDAHGLLGLVSGAAATLRILSQTLLDCNRLQMHVLQLCREPCDLAELAQRAADTIQPLDPSRALVLKTPPGGVPAVGDREVLHRVLFVLLWNGIKNAPDRSTVDTTFQSDDNQVTVVVCDRGPAIPAGYQDAVFDILRQSRLNTAGHGRSAGPGLAYCRLAVQAHGGDIGCGSDDAGTHFWFSIPNRTP